MGARRAVRPSTRSLRSLAQDEAGRARSGCTFAADGHPPHPEQAKRLEGWARDGPCVLRRAPSGRLLRMRQAELAQDVPSPRMDTRLILSKRSASKDGRATARASFDALPPVAC